MDRDVLLHHMTERFRELYNQALDALDRAPEGQWIAAGEWVFRDAFQRLLTESYQATLQGLRYTPTLHTCHALCTRGIRRTPHVLPLSLEK